jgi:hypothetical protein
MVYPYKTYLTGWRGIDPTTASTDPNPTMVNMTFKFHDVGFIVGLRYFRDNADAGNHFGLVTKVGASGLQGSCVFPVVAAGASPVGPWQSAYISPRIPVAVNDIFVAKVWFRNGLYWLSPNALSVGTIWPTDHVEQLNDAPAGIRNGTINQAVTLLPPGSGGGNRYGVDVLFFVP